MINKSVVVAVLARDCDDNLRLNIPQIDELRSHFRQSRVVVVENDSKDGTKQTLKNWQKQSQGVDLIMNDFGTQTIPTGVGGSTSLHRIEKMARYRNMYMDFVRGLDEQPDYLIVIDVDVEDFSVAGVIKAIENAPQDWSALFANGQLGYRCGFYFDAFALVLDGDKTDLKLDEMFYQSKVATKKLSKMGYLPCISAFSGIGVYKWETIKNLNYQAVANHRSKTMQTLCEHVPFNAQIKNNYICRQMKIVYGKRSLKHILTYSILPNFCFRFIYRIFNGEKFED